LLALVASIGLGPTSSPGQTDARIYHHASQARRSDPVRHEGKAAPMSLGYYRKGPSLLTIFQPAM
jgi:hypothetical protein